MRLRQERVEGPARCRGLVLALALLAFGVTSHTVRAAPLAPRAEWPIPGGAPGIGFDDIGYFPALDRVSIPAGQTGMLDLIDPHSGAITARYRVGPKQSFAGHREGTTSAAYGDGYLFASDHGRDAVEVLDARSGEPVARVPLASGPDYVRFLSSRQELWVTEPRGEQIQVFQVHRGAKPTFLPIATIAVPGGPESLVFDTARGRAYTNLWKTTTVALDLVQRAVSGRWRDGWAGPRGLALDETRATLFVGCAEGAVTALDLKADGHILAKATAGAGIDIIQYAPLLKHLYVPGARAATLTVFRVGDSGTMQPIARYRTAQGAHCVTDDGRGRVFVCDPKAGRILEYRDEPADGITGAPAPR